MNPNIEVITPELWAVNGAWIKAGYIQELRWIPGKSANQIMLTNTGIMILDKSSKLYPALKKLFPVVQKMDQAKLEEIIERNGGLQSLNPLGDLWVNVVGWEIKRRCVRAEYLKSLPKLTFTNVVTGFLRKVGGRYGYHSDSD